MNHGSEDDELFPKEDEIQSTLLQIHSTKLMVCYYSEVTTLGSDEY